MFYNPQFPTGNPVPLNSNVAPTELMPLQGYKTVGRIAGIQNTSQFKPFSNVGINARYAQQSMRTFGNGIQTGQYINQPLTSTKE